MDATTRLRWRNADSLQHLGTLVPGRELVLHADAVADASASSVPSPVTATAAAAALPDFALPLLTVLVVDSSLPKHKTSCGAVVAPQGNEWKWSFVSPSGRLDMVNDSRHARVFIVYLNRGHEFGALSYAGAQIALQPLLEQGMYAGAPRRIAFFNKQSVDPLGRRKVLEMLSSEFGGQLFVEDVVDYSLPDRPMPSLARVPERLSTPAPRVRSAAAPLAAAVSPVVTRSKRKTTAAAGVDMSPQKADAPKQARSSPGEEAAEDSSLTSPTHRLTEAIAAVAVSQPPLPLPQPPAEQTYGRVVRRLFFLSDTAAIQSEARVLYPSNQHSLDSLTPHSSMEAQHGVLDATYLPFEYHQAIVGALLFCTPLMALASETALSCRRCSAIAHKVRARGLSSLMVGLGGGGLALFLSECIIDPAAAASAGGASSSSLSLSSTTSPLRQLIRVEALELDPAVVEVARRWFGCAPDLVDVRVADGCAFVYDLARRIAAASSSSSASSHDGGDATSAASECDPAADLRKDIIIIDVDSKDLSDTMLSFPPPVFVEVAYLRAVRACLRPRGALLINFGVHQTSMRREIVQRVHSVFGEGGVYEISIETDQNRILVALMPGGDDDDAGECSLCSPIRTREDAVTKLPLLANILAPAAAERLMLDIGSMVAAVRVWHAPGGAASVAAEVDSDQAESDSEVA